MLIIDPSDIRPRLSLEDRQEINDFLRSAILGATPRLEALLNTSFTKGTAEDFFVLNPAIYEPVDGHFVLRLSNGFVRSSPALAASSGESLDGPFSTVSGCVLRASKGFLLVPESNAGKTFKVAYSYGFQNNEEVPAWLREVALCYSVKVMSMAQLNDRKDDLSAVYEFVDLHSAEILDRHLRTHTFAIPALCT